MQGLFRPVVLLSEKKAPAKRRGFGLQRRADYGV
jgi:hypothetical protein